MGKISEMFIRTPYSNLVDLSSLIQLGETPTSENRTQRDFLQKVVSVTIDHSWARLSRHNANYDGLFIIILAKKETKTPIKSIPYLRR